MQFGHLTSKIFGMLHGVQNKNVIKDWSDFIYKDRFKYVWLG